jgi:hypothetical protein
MAITSTFGRILLLGVCADVVHARLLAPGKNATVLDADFPNIPVVQFMRSQKHSHRVGSTVASCATRGIPTHFESAGCKKIAKVYDEVKRENTGVMSLTMCFAFCSKRKLTYFGITNGAECWCGAAFDGIKLDEKDCDKPCAGNPAKMCGGIEGTSVYNMIDCTEPTAAEKAQAEAEKKEALLNSYGSFDGETCGTAKEAVLQLDGKGYLSGDVDSCKIACWKAQGSESCAGFTYDAFTDKCTFLYDVTDGAVTKKKEATCYFKIL